MYIYSDLLSQYHACSSYFACATSFVSNQVKKSCFHSPDIWDIRSMVRRHHPRDRSQATGGPLKNAPAATRIFFDVCFK